MTDNNLQHVLDMMPLHKNNKYLSYGKRESFVYYVPLYDWDTSKGTYYLYIFKDHKNAVAFCDPALVTKSKDYAYNEAARWVFDNEYPKHF